VDPWYGLLAPAATPTAVLARLEAVAMAAVADPTVRTRLSGMGAQPIGNSASAFAEAIRADLARYRAVAEAARITAD
jgi:tripartite-type tricarboxylate transporter receptor subunit TctC